MLATPMEQQKTSIDFREEWHKVPQSPLVSLL